MNKKIILALLCFFCLGIISCERYPIRALLGYHDQMDSWPDVWYLYDDEINTKGSMEPQCWDDGWDKLWTKGRLDFACMDNPKNGSKCIKFTWIGNIGDPNYAGFGLMATEYNGGIVNLSNSGYTNLKFWIRGNLTQNCVFKIEVPKKGSSTPWVSYSMDNTRVTSNWQEVVIPLTNITLMTEIEYDIAMSLSASSGTESNGGTVFLDDIRFTKD